MSAPKYLHRRLGFLVGSMLLSQVPELLTLVPSQLKRSFRSKNEYEVCSAVSMAAAICTKEISNYIEDDLARLLTYSKPSIRKRGCALAKKLILNNFHLGSKIAAMLKNILNDSDVSVLIAATCSILDCAVVYPHLFVQAIPALYHLLEGNNTWLATKALQALCLLLEYEKRLYKKLGNKVSQLLNTVHSLSIQAELHKQIALHFKDVPVLIGETRDQVLKYMESGDVNVRHIGLVILKVLLEGNGSLFTLYREKVMRMVGSGDKAIKVKALRIISEYVFAFE
eukprot:TRINITY_DN4615_c0_g1_i1.p1 TRINITY_DN4615_c0_g1~~TRINITY_DN4615_c0_g1_i1.p1  ORF type:complete len:283 (+),score=49.14 TRINITY_DN4615_c0_g1_i1:351-1199(+)